MANKKRFLAIVLSLVLVLQMLPTSALGVTFYSARLSGADYYTVVFVASGETVATQYVESGATLTLPQSPTAAGKSFTGWVDAEGEPVTSATTVSGNMTVTAVFEDISVYTVIVKYVLADNPSAEVATKVQRQYFRSYNTDDGAGRFDVSSDEIVSPAVVSYGGKEYYPSQTKVVVEPDTLESAETTFTVTYSSADTQYEIRHYIMKKVTAEDGSVSFTKEGATEMEDVRESDLSGASGAQILPTPKTFDGLTFVEAEPVTLVLGAENIAKVYYQPELVTLTYDSQGGSYVDPKTTYSGESVVVYETEPITGDSVLTCGKEVHTRIAPTGNPGWHNSQSGCYKAQWDWDHRSYSWVLSCVKTEHTNAS